MLLLPPLHILLLLLASNIGTTYKCSSVFSSFHDMTAIKRVLHIKTPSAECDFSFGLATVSLSGSSFLIFSRFLHVNFRPPFLFFRSRWKWRRRKSSQCGFLARRCIIFSFRSRSRASPPSLSRLVQFSCILLANCGRNWKYLSWWVCGRRFFLRLPSFLPSSTRSFPLLLAYIRSLDAHHS